MIRTVNPLGDEQRLEYDNNGNQTRVQDWNGRGVSLAFNRSYGSNGGSAPGPLGVGWHHPYASRVTLTPCNEAIVIGGAGGGMRFVDDGQGGLKPLRGYHGSLIQDESTRSFDFSTTNTTA